MDFGSHQRKEKDIWQAMRFGCCASKGEVDEEKDALRENGMSWLHSCPQHFGFKIQHIFPMSLRSPRDFIALSVVDFLDQCHYLNCSVELRIGFAYSLLNLVNRYHNRTLSHHPAPNIPEPYCAISLNAFTNDP
jgi:hypothetical protein